MPGITKTKLEDSNGKTYGFPLEGQNNKYICPKSVFKGGIAYHTIQLGSLADGTTTTAIFVLYVVTARVSSK